MALIQRARSGLGLFIISALVGWWALPAPGSSGGPALAPGSDDPRGFRLVGVHPETGEGVRYNPCKPIHYVINPALAPPNAVQDIHTAFEMTAQASGLRFVYDGETDEVAGPDRAPYQPDRYGQRWAPVLIAWADGLPQQWTEGGPEAANPIGWGGSHPMPNDQGKAVFVTGSAVFDAGNTEIRGGFGGETWGQAMLHELGHVLGLGHYSAPDSVMNPELGLRAAAWGPGDRAGLWKQGIGSPCLKEPPLP